MSEQQEESKGSWGIELRNGNYFQNLRAGRSGPRETAQRFASKEAAERFTREHEWILWYGGMAVPLEQEGAFCPCHVVPPDLDSMLKEQGNNHDID